MTCWRDVKANHSFVYVARAAAKFIEPRKREFIEGDTEFANKVTIHEGDGGKFWPSFLASGRAGFGGLWEVPCMRLHADGGGFAVSFQCRSTRDCRASNWQRLFVVPAIVKPFDLAVSTAMAASI